MTVIRRLFLITMGLLIALVVSSCGGSAQSTQSSIPKDHFNAPGNILISDQFNNRVVEVAPDGHIVWTFGSGNPTLCNPGPGAIIAAILVGAVMSYPAISLPGEISYISSIAPIALALGAPIAPLALLVAVEMIPDIFRTLGNVTFDVALTTLVDRSLQKSSRS